jgi:hypothetical protein
MSTSAAAVLATTALYAQNLVQTHPFLFTHTGVLAKKDMPMGHARLITLQSTRRSALCWKVAQIRHGPATARSTLMSAQVPPAQTTLYASTRFATISFLYILSGACAALVSLTAGVSMIS